MYFRYFYSLNFLFLIVIVSLHFSSNLYFINLYLSSFLLIPSHHILSLCLVYFCYLIVFFNSIFDSTNKSFPFPKLIPLQTSSLPLFLSIFTSFFNVQIVRVKAWITIIIMKNVLQFFYSSLMLFISSSFSSLLRLNIMRRSLCSSQITYIQVPYLLLLLF